MQRFSKIERSDTDEESCEGCGAPAHLIRGLCDGCAEKEELYLAQRAWEEQRDDEDPV